MGKKKQKKRIDSLEKLFILMLGLLAGGKGRSRVKR